MGSRTCPDFALVRRRRRQHHEARLNQPSKGVEIRFRPHRPTSIGEFKNVRLMLLIESQIAVHHGRHRHLVKRDASERNAQFVRAPPAEVTNRVELVPIQFQTAEGVRRQRKVKRRHVVDVAITTIDREVLIGPLDNDTTRDEMLYCLGIAPGWLAAFLADGRCRCTLDCGRAPLDMAAFVHPRVCSKVGTGQRHKRYVTHLASGFAEGLTPRGAHVACHHTEYLRHAWTYHYPTSTCDRS
ncbi:hypothetical protein DFJ74DRAFT_439345 [Hyaloraphidium curvatum]|nr:hypothetical protein DFJ74DRAFT_439345 [Hyaloraphidium curvatum]